jgi:hypothetical protein
VNNATAGFPVSMRSLATNEIEYTDATGIVLHTDLHGAVNMREATPEEMRLSQLVSPSMAVEVEEQGIGGRDLLNARVANEDLSDRISAATVTPVATFSGNLVNDTIANGVGGGTIDFTVNMETGAVNDLIVDFTTPTNTIEITQTGEITLDGLGGFRSDNYSINPGLSITNQTGLTYSGVTNVVVNGNNIRSGIPNVNVLLNNGGYLEDRLNDTGLNRR